MNEIYQMDNPCWLSDTFIFSEKDFNGDKKYIFIKINSRNKIEEIGVDFDQRRNGGIDFSKVATKLQKSIFRRIDNEYWWGLYNHEQRKIRERIK